MQRHHWQVVLLPGAVMPAEPAYRPLLDELGSDVDARPKDLELYAADAPPPGYSLATEVTGVTRFSDDVGFERFHLVGYSGGGAAALEFAATRPERLLSVALIEPAFAGVEGMSTRERAHFDRLPPLLDLDDRELFPAFQRLQVADDVELASPPPGPPPDWMARRPAGIRAILGAFFASDLGLASLGSFDRPVWLAYGGRSHPDYFALMAERLGRAFPDITVDVFPDRHHFDPPHRVEPARVAAALRALWTRAEPPNT